MGKRHDEAHVLTDKKLHKLENRIASEYKKAADELQDKIDAYFEQFRKRDAEQKALIGETVNGKKYTEHDYKQWRLAQIGRGKRFEALRDRLAEQMTKANVVAAAYINDSSPGIYSLNRNYAAYTIEEQIGRDVGFDLWDEQTVKRLIVEEPDLMPYYPPKRAVNRGIDLAFEKHQISAQVTSGILQGESIKHLADRLQTHIPEMNRNSAIRAARTAVTGAQNAGRMDSYARAEEMGIKLKKQWVATLDGRTRHAHQLLDGQTQPNDKPFQSELGEIMFPGDPNATPANTYNCRCTLVAEVEDVDTSGAKRRARDTETGENVVIEDMTYAEWAKTKMTKRNESVEDIQGVLTNPKNIIPVNNVTNKDKFAALVYDFEHTGYSGRPIVVAELGDGEYQALTGSHRIFAAREAGIDIPTVTVEYNKKTAALFDVSGDEERAKIAEKLYKTGGISKDAYRLLSYEEEANLSVSEQYTEVVKKKAELYKAEQEAKKVADDAAKKAAELAKEKEAQEFARAREESAEMAEYKAFLEEMNKKYGEENIWSDMNDNEYDKMERLERVAYTGK